MVPEGARCSIAMGQVTCKGHGGAIVTCWSHPIVTEGFIVPGGVKGPGYVDRP